MTNINLDDVLTEEQLAIFEKNGFCDVYMIDETRGKIKQTYKKVIPSSLFQPTKEEQKKAKDFLNEYRGHPVKTKDDIVERGLQLSEFPLHSMVGFTNVEIFDSETLCRTDNGWYGKIVEWLLTWNLPNSSEEMDSAYIGEIKTKPFKDGFKGGIEIKTNMNKVVFSNFDNSAVYNKIKNGIILIGMTNTGRGKTISVVFELDTSHGSLLYNQFKSDYEYGMLNKHNEFLKFGTKNSGTTKTITIPQFVINNNAKKLASFYMV